MFNPGIVIRREDICLVNDFAFKYHVMQYREVAKYILSTLLGEKITDIEVMDKERLGKDELKKTYFADYVAYVNHNTDLHMEMQNRKEEYDIDRILHYFARLVDKDMMKGDVYHGNRKIVIWFHNYGMAENKGLVQDYQILNSPHYVVKLVNLSRLNNVLNKPVKQMSSIERLCIYLRYSHISRYKSLIKKLRKEEKGIDIMEKNIQGTLQHPNEYFDCRDIHAYFKRRKEMKELEIQRKQLEKEQHLREEEQRLREEEQRLREEEQRLRVEESNKRKQAEQKQFITEQKCKELEKQLEKLVLHQTNYLFKDNK